MSVEYTTTTYEDDKCIVRIHRPILSETERTRREEQLKKVLIRYERARMKGV